MAETNGTAETMDPGSAAPVGETGAPAGSEVVTPEVQTPAEPTAEDILKFDPFGPAVEEKPAPKVEDAGKKVEPKVTAPVAAPVAPPVQKSSRETELEGQIAALKSVIERSATQPQVQPSSQAATPEAPKYNLAIPEPLIAALRGEEDKDFGLAMNSIVNGIANRIYQDVKAEMSQQAEQLPMRVQEVLHNVTTAQQRTEQVRRDFYGAYPHLNNQMLYPIVQQAAMQVARSWAAQGKQLDWTPEFMGEMAQLIHQVIPAPQQQQQPAPAPARVQPPYQARPGTRPPVAQPDEFVDMLNSVR